jgi:folate-binding protein YgfZ
MPAVYGHWLNLKGKVIADSFILNGATPHEFWVGSYFSSAATIRERLEGHIIADDVAIADQTGDWAGVTVFGSDARGLPSDSDGDILRFPGRRDRERATECMYRRHGDEPRWLLGSPAPRLDADTVERRRIAAGIPAVPIDVGPGDLPNEAGLDAEAISYTKGCYLGQEVMARLKSMGQVRRRLLRVRGTGDAPSSLPAPLFVGSRQVGDVRSATRHETEGWIGLAMLSLLHVKADSTLSCSADAAPSVRLRDSP